MYMDNLKLRSLIRTDWFVWVAFLLPCTGHAHGDKWLLSAKEEYVSSFFSLFMGLCAMLLYPPVADLYRHWVNFQDIKLFEWNDFLFFLGVNIKVGFPITIVGIYFYKIWYLF